MEFKEVLKKLLVANRGEICDPSFSELLNELWNYNGLVSFSKEDRLCLISVSKADESYQLNPDKGPIDAYLDINTIISYCKREERRCNSSRLWIFYQRILTL